MLFLVGHFSFQLIIFFQALLMAARAKLTDTSKSVIRCILLIPIPGQPR
jgi:hypothetical protein